MNKIRRVGFVGIGLCIISFVKNPFTLAGSIVIAVAGLIFISMVLFGKPKQQSKN